MAIGRPRLPDQVKQLTGTLQPSRIVPNQPKPPAGIPVPPAHISEPAKAVWMKLCNVLAMMNLLTPVEAFVVEQFCDHWVIRQRCMAVIEAEGLSYETTNPTGDSMHRPRPEVAILHKTDHVLMQLQTKMGLSPADRSRISVVIGDNEKPDDELDIFG